MADLRRRALPSKLHVPYPAESSPPRVQASDALPRPTRHTNKLFSFLFMASLYFLMTHWCEKVRSSTPLHILSLAEISAVVGFLSSLIYLISFFGIAYVQSFISSDIDIDVDAFLKLPSSASPCPLQLDQQGGGGDCARLSKQDEKIVSPVVSGKTPSYVLESQLGDTCRAAGVRYEALRCMPGRSLEGLPLDGFDYDSILGQCCEMPDGRRE